MPFAVLKSIREVTSEDKLHCASNLLKNDLEKKWKTGETGENSAYVIIEMESEYVIRGIDIGNECSAFVEVLVGNATCAREKFKEILITCSFMTPSESRTCSMPNRVRCFNREALVKDIASQKWKLLKIICSQPFNKDINYGLSFIKIHVDEPSKPKKEIVPNNCLDTQLTNRTFGNFSLREDSPDSEAESTTALFNRWKVSKNKELSTISNVPRTPTPAVLKKPIESFTVKKAATPSAPTSRKDDAEERCVFQDRNRNSLLFGDDDDDDGEQSAHVKRKKKLEILEKAIAADQERVTKENKEAKKSKRLDTSTKDRVSEETPKKQKPDKKVPSEKEQSPKTAKLTKSPSTSGQRRTPSSPCVSDKPKKLKLDKPIQYKPFNSLLDGVVLVISGIQNPDRADLRNKALALGAKYKGDWDNSSTHLICAFKNTPKYNQVKGVGKIVKRSWVEDCYTNKRNIPWRRYALDNEESLKPESEDELLDESLKPQEESQPVALRKNSNENSDDVLAEYDNNEINHLESSGSDTEDEIEKVLAKKSPQKKPAQTRDVFEISTEEEDYVSSKNKVDKTDKTTFFKGIKFFISNELSATTKIKVDRCVETFDGVLTTSIDEANYFIADYRPLDSSSSFKGETVSPLWILECFDAECLIPTKRYLVK